MALAEPLAEPLQSSFIDRGIAPASTMGALLLTSRASLASAHAACALVAPSGEASSSTRTNPPKFLSCSSWFNLARTAIGLNALLGA
jgi:hypothetical protein